MIGLLQRVKSGAVNVDGETIGQIAQGLVVLIGIERGDSMVQGKRLCERLLGYRVFADEQGRMNLSISDINGGLLLVPQFTLAADTRKGTRPGFSTAAAPDEAQRLFETFVEYTRGQYPHIQCGRFGADMQLSLVNDGPVTFWLQVAPKAAD